MDHILMGHKSFQFPLIPSFYYNNTTQTCFQSKILKKKKKLKYY